MIRCSSVLPIFSDSVCENCFLRWEAGAGVVRKVLGLVDLSESSISAACAAYGLPIHLLQNHQQ